MTAGTPLRAVNPKCSLGVRTAMLTPATLPKDAKALPPEAQKVFLDAYNRDFAVRCQEGHAEKAAWRVVGSRWPDLVPKE